VQHSKKYLILMVALLVFGVSSPTTAGSLLPERQPVIQVDPATGEHSTRISVLIYNVKAIPWPFLWGRSGDLKKIQATLASWQQAGTAPDVVLFQEAFRDRPRKMGKKVGYPDWARGPKKGDDAEKLPSTNNEFVTERSFMKGERLGKVMSSGLAAFSEFRIVKRIAQPFKRHACAGYDCFANKGLLLVSIQIPGVPVPIDIVTTHLNSKKSSGVPDTRSFYAYQLQVDELTTFINEHRDPTHPLILGGDFNLRESPNRLKYVREKVTFPFVRAWCHVDPSVCRSKVKGVDPWHSQDQQVFNGSPVVNVEPIATDEVFDSEDGKVLSDHSGFLVTYRISWFADTSSNTQLAQN